MALDTRIPLMGQGVDTATPLAALASGLADKQRYDQQMAMKADEIQYQREQDAQRLAMQQQQLELAKSRDEWERAPEEEKRMAIKEIQFTSRLKSLMSNPDAAEAFAADPANHFGEHAKEMAAAYLNDPDPEKKNFLNEANAAEQFAVQIGAIKGSSAAEGFTLGAGQKRFDAQGNLIASGPEKAPAGMTAITNPTTGEVSYVQNKPLPPSIAKQQDELLGDLRTAANLNADLSSIVQDINAGKVDLGIVSNQMAKARNAGLLPTTPESRNVANLMATLQRMRNDSLRLNKGTQTEGDAIRAWDEILGGDSKNPTMPRDNQLLSSALSRIAAYNERSAQEKAIRIETIRNEYGKEPLDISKISDVRPSFKMESENEDPIESELRKRGVLK